jgi:hypothetical protein
MTMSAPLQLFGLLRSPREIVKRLVRTDFGGCNGGSVLDRSRRRGDGDGRGEVTP